MVKYTAIYHTEITEFPNCLIRLSLKKEIFSDREAASHVMHRGSREGLWSGGMTGYEPKHHFPFQPLSRGE